MKINKIIAGIDFEKESEKVIAYSGFFAKNFNAGLNLLYVIDYLVTPPLYLAPYIEEESKNAKEKFNVIKVLLTQNKIDTSTEIMTGRLQESFQAALTKTGANLLVLGFVHHLLRRSSSEKLIKSFKMPMLVVRGEKTEKASLDSLKIKRILCPFDFSDISEQALVEAGMLSKLFNAELDILYVVPDFISNKRVQEKIKYEEIMKPLLDESMINILEIMKKNNIIGTPYIERYEPDKGIVEHSRSRDTDLIVMGARGLGFIKGMLIGSVTDAVLKSSPCPVLVIH